MASLDQLGRLSAFDHSSRRDHRVGIVENVLQSSWVRVARGCSIIPATRIIDWEVGDACFRDLGAQGYDLSK